MDLAILFPVRDHILRELEFCVLQKKMSNTQFLWKTKNYVKSYLRNISSQSIWSITPTSSRCWHIRWHGDWRGHGGWGRIPFEVDGLFRRFAINGIIEVYRMQWFVPENKMGQFLRILVTSRLEIGNFRTKTSCTK